MRPIEDDRRSLPKQSVRLRAIFGTLVSIWLSMIGVIVLIGVYAKHWINGLE